MARRLVALLLLAAPSLAEAAEPTYWQDVRPVLRRHCTVCHSARNLDEVDVSGGIALDSYEAILKARRPLFKSGHGDKSLLVKVLLLDDPAERMPLGARPVPAETVALLRAWIDAGAKEGQRPEGADLLTGPATVPRVRKRDVVLPTKATAPPSLSGSAPRAPLQLVLPVGPLAPVTSVAFSPDGNLVAAASYGRVVLWDLRTGRPAKTLTNVLGTVSAVRFSPDGQTLAVAGGQPSARGDLRLFDAPDWKLRAVLLGHDDVVSAVSFSPDGARLASAAFDRTVRIWDMKTGKVERILTGHTDFVYTVDFGPGAAWLASAGKDRSVKLVDSATGKGRLALGEREQDVLAVAVSPDGNALVVSGNEPALTWWDAGTGEKVRTLGGHTAAVHELAFSRDGKLLVSCSSDGTARVWNGTTGAQLRQFPVGSVVYGVALSADGKRLATGGFDGCVRLWDAGTARLHATLLALPPEAGETPWLILTPEGYAAGTPALTAAGRWRAGDTDLPAPALWKALLNRAQVGHALHGDEVKPAFTN